MHVSLVDIRLHGRFPFSNIFSLIISILRASTYTTKSKSETDDWEDVKIRGNKQRM